MTREPAGADDSAVARVDVNAGHAPQAGPDSLEISDLPVLQQLNRASSYVVIEGRAVLGDAARQAESSTAVNDLAEAAARGKNRAVTVAHETPQRRNSGWSRAAVAEPSSFQDTIDVDGAQRSGQGTRGVREQSPSQIALIGPRGGTRRAIRH